MFSGMTHCMLRTSFYCIKCAFSVLLCLCNHDFTQIFGHKIKIEQSIICAKGFVL